MESGRGFFKGWGKTLRRYVVNCQGDLFIHDLYWQPQAYAGMVGQYGELQAVFYTYNQYAQKLIMIFVCSNFYIHTIVVSVL